MNTLAAARDYARRGWRVVPAEAGQKQCYRDGWPDLIIDPASLPEFFGPAENVAVIVGAPSGELVDVDLDCVEALELADIYLPQTGATFGRASRPRSHRLYVAPGALFQAFADPLRAGDMLLELRATGRTGGAHQTLLPPSSAAGERRRWHGETIAPAAVDAEKLHRRCACLAIGCLTARHVSEHAARQPGADLPGLLWEADEKLGRRAYRWLGLLAPDETPRRNTIRRQIDLGEVDLDAVVRAIQNNCSWPEWNNIGLAIFAASQGSDRGCQIFHDFSARSSKYKPHAVAERWANYRRSPPSRIGLGTLIYLAREAGWRT